MTGDPNHPAPAPDPRDLALLDLAAENADLRARLGEAQDQCVEMAVDAGELQAEIDRLRADLALLRADTGIGGGGTHGVPQG